VQLRERMNSITRALSGVKEKKGEKMSNRKKDSFDSTINSLSLHFRGCAKMQVLLSRTDGACLETCYIPDASASGCYSAIPTEFYFLHKLFNSGSIANFNFYKFGTKLYRTANRSQQHGFNDRNIESITIITSKGHSLCC